MKGKARIQSHETTMLDNVLCSFESALVLVAGRNSPRDSRLGQARVVRVCHQDRNLGTELGQLERTFGLVS
jgi:hypothetical protein